MLLVLQSIPLLYVIKFILLFCRHSTVLGTFPYEQNVAHTSTKTYTCWFKRESTKSFNLIIWHYKSFIFHNKIQRKGIEYKLIKIMVLCSYLCKCDTLDFVMCIIVGIYIQVSFDWTHLGPRCCHSIRLLSTLWHFDKEVPPKISTNFHWFRFIL